MKIRHLVESLFFFALVTSLPLLKVFLLGNFDSYEQSKYIKVYFWLQFLVPIVDFGYYWSIVKSRVTDNIVTKYSSNLNLIGVVFALMLLPVNFFYSQLLLLATVTAWYNFRLQILRIEGLSRAYYFMRLSKMFLDVIFVFSLYMLSVLSVELLVMAEFLSVIVVMLVVSHREHFDSSIFIFNYSRFFSFDYLYTLLKVVRSNFLRLSIPLVFFGQGLEGVLFAILFYELFAQYLSIEKLKDLLEGKVKVITFLIIYIISLPVQYGGIYSVAQVMGWHFEVLDIICIILGGAARIFAVYTLNIVKNNSFDLLVFLNVFFVLFGVVEIFAYKEIFIVENPAQLALLTFYGVEFFVGLGLIIWLERPGFLKRM